MIDDLDAVHDASGPFRRRIDEGRGKADASRDMRFTVHPVVTTHPVSGRRSLFVNPTFTTGIVGLPPRESDRVLELLFEAVHAPDVQVRLRWRPGTVAMWDNRCTQHYVAGGYGSRRVMQRVTFLGPEPAR